MRTQEYGDILDEARRKVLKHIDATAELVDYTRGFFRGVNWPLLREQKQDLIAVSADLESKGMTEIARSLDGITHLLDGLQDLAADAWDIPGVFAEDDDD